MFTAAKDAIASRGAQTYLNSLIARYGEVRDLRIDSVNKTLEASCLLRGETTPIHLSADYLVETVSGINYASLKHCRCNKPWLENLLTDYGRERRIELPAWASALV
jgi:hypothetical protein